MSEVAKQLEQELDKLAATSKAASEGIDTQIATAKAHSDQRSAVNLAMQKCQDEAGALDQAAALPTPKEEVTA